MTKGPTLAVEDYSDQVDTTLDLANQKASDILFDTTWRDNEDGEAKAKAVTQKKSDRMQKKIRPKEFGRSNRSRRSLGTWLSTRVVAGIRSGMKRGTPVMDDDEDDRWVEVWD